MLISGDFGLPSAFYAAETHHLTLYTEDYSFVKPSVASAEDSSKLLSAAIASGLSELPGVLDAISTFV